MNWNNIPNLKFKVYDPELKKFFAGNDDIAPKINSGSSNEFVDSHKDRYYICYNETGLIFGFYQQNGDWEDCKLFPWSTFKDKNGTELYLYDKVRHIDSDFKGVVDFVEGKWVVRYDSQRVVPLADRVEYIEFTGNPDLD